MKKIILGFILALAVVGMIATPAMAAKISFDTNLVKLSGPGTVSGSLENGFTLTTFGAPNLKTYLQLAGATADPDLADGYYGLTLKANASQKKPLYNYFADKAWSDPTWYTQINKEIVGCTPFLYLKAEGGQYELVDAFIKAIFDIDSPFAIDDDYPEGTYIVQGLLKGEDNSPLMLKVSLTVVRD